MIHDAPTFFIPETIMCGTSKRDSDYKTITIKKSNGSYLFPSWFESVTGYAAVDKPRDSALLFERDATGRVNYYDNEPTENLKICGTMVMYKELCVIIKDPRGWTTYIPYNHFMNLFIKYHVAVDNNATLVGKFRYATNSDMSFAIIPDGTQIKGMKTWLDIKDERKKLRSKKVNLEVGKVYDYWDKTYKTYKRMLFLGIHGGIIGNRIMNQYTYKLLPKEVFEKKRYIWLDLHEDSFGVHTGLTTYCNETGKFDPLTGKWYGRYSYDLHRKLDNNEFVSVKVKDVDRYNTALKPVIQNSYSNINLRDVREFTYFDHFIDIPHNYEFSMYNLITLSGIDKAAIDKESSDQSYQPTRPSYRRNNMIIKKEDLPIFPIKWTLEDLIDASRKLSQHFFNRNQKRYDVLPAK